MSKIQTPGWILKGGKKLKNKKEKKFTMKFCPNCKSRDVGVIIGGETGMWECHKCNFQNAGFPEIELNEKEFLDYLDREEKEK